jgi:polyribonucleotide nucleotidyltransferase
MGKLGNHEVSAEIGGATITFETGKTAGQAGGAVVAHLGETIIHATTTASSRPKEHLDFFPLTVDYEEKSYAAGKIPGGFFKREGRASEAAILVCRLVDRPLRPLFDNGLRNEIQVLLLALSADQEHTPDVLAINAASMSTLLAGIPFDGPVAGLRMAMDIDGNWTPFPTFSYLAEEAVFDLVVAGRLNKESGEIDIVMVEAEATENAVIKIEMGATKPSEEIIGQALEESKQHLKRLCDLQLELVELAGTRDAGDYPLFPPYADKVRQAVERAVGDDLAAVFADTSLDKAARNAKVSELKEQAIDAVFDDAGDVEVSDEQLESQAKNAFRAVEKVTIRRRVVNDGVRIDGRGPKDLRELSSEVGVLPRAHGSGLFRRGETQVLNILTLGMTRDAQRLDTIDPITAKRYIHHYNFLPFSTGETGFMRGPKRREIGHGALAERALRPVVPSVEDFPYALRLVSEVLSSNGSTSMASVCASTLSLMDAGVPIHAPVAGVAMGLISEDGKVTTLTDILGAEDAFGDMDFKVTGTADFVTALQLDTKLQGLTADLLADALLQAKEARLEVLDNMLATISEPRAEMNPSAPRVLTEYIPADKIGEVIGPKGKIIREITETTGADVNIDDVDGRGVVQIYSTDGAKAQAALDMVRAIANPVIPKEGERYFGTIVKTVDFGAFVSLTPGNDGLLHISKLPKPEGKRLEHADEAVSIGDKVWVEVSEVKDGRKFSLSLVEGPDSEAAAAAAAEDTGKQSAAAAPEAAREERGDRGGRSSDGGGRERTRERSSGGGGEGRSSERSRGGDDEGGDAAPRRRTRRRS